MISKLESDSLLLVLHELAKGGVFPAFCYGGKMENTDIVYILKNGIADECEELRFSIRSVVKNWSYRNIWFVGGDPKAIVPDGAIYHQQEGGTRYERVRSSMLLVADCGYISDDFFLFNDDFFIMRPVTEWGYFYHDNIEDHARSLRDKYAGGSLYEKEIDYSGEVLRAYGYTTKNYSLHIPFKVNKEKMMATFDKFPSSSMFKNLYGNMHNVGGTHANDVKVLGLHEYPPVSPVISTNNATFNHGYVGRIIKDTFGDPSEYERGNK